MNTRIKTTISGFLALTIVAFSISTFTGCGNADMRDTVIAKANSTNMARLSSLYRFYQDKNGYVGPEDEATFKEFVKQMDVRTLTRISVDPNDLDKLFVSERDGQPFKIRYGVVGSARGCSEAAIFENEGQDGKRMVRFLNGAEREVESGEYDDLFEGKIAAPAAPKRSDQRGG